MRVLTLSAEITLVNALYYALYFTIRPFVYYCYSRRERTDTALVAILGWRRTASGEKRIPHHTKVRSGLREPMIIYSLGMQSLTYYNYGIHI